MSYLVLARKYRPQTLGDLAGQEAIATTLSNALAQERVSHALILCGPRGVGKTSTARILAKSLNCTASPGPTPCGSCEACNSIAAGNNMDVIEIDGASNNGVENIRDLRDNVKFATAAARFKIYIIDEVHMLSTPAFNALLKTLEEPPAHVKFIFATTEIHKVPETIRSRTQRFDFKLVPPDAIAAHLTTICTAEGIEYDDEALLAIAAAGHGSIRDALTLLDQAIVYADGKIEVATVTAMTGALSFEKTFAIGSELIATRGGKALELVDELLNAGIAVDQIFGQLIELFRSLMIAPENPAGMEGMFNLTPDQLERIRAVRWSQESAIYALQILNKSRAEAHLYPEPRIALEMALVRAARIDNIVALADIVSGKKKVTIAEAEATAAAPEAVVPPAAVPQTSQPSEEPHVTKPVEPTPAAAQDEAAEAVQEEIEEAVEETAPQKAAAASAEAPAADTSKTGEPFVLFIAEIAKRFPSFAALLQAAEHQCDGATHRFIIKGADPFKMERLCARSEKIELALKTAYGAEALLSLEAYEEDEPAAAPQTQRATPAPQRTAPLSEVPTMPAAVTPAAPAISPSTETSSAPAAVAPPVELPWDDMTPQPLQAEESPQELPQQQSGSISSAALLQKANENEHIQALKSAFNCTIMNVSQRTKE